MTAGRKVVSTEGDLRKYLVDSLARRRLLRHLLAYDDIDFLQDVGQSDILEDRVKCLVAKALTFQDSSFVISLLVWLSRSSRG